jgi:uncharacterized protein (UPF0332 family)
MEEKARSNLKAAAVLVNAQLFDSAASRAYYAAYLLVVARCKQPGATS